MIPVRFMPMIRKKNVIRTGMKRLPSFSPRVSNDDRVADEAEHVLECGLSARGHQLHAARAEPQDR